MAGYFKKDLVPRISQPQNPVGIDKDSSFSDGLVFSWVAYQEMSVDQVTGSPPSSASGVTYSATASGIGASINTTNSINYAIVPFIGIDKYTIAAVAAPPASVTRSHLYFSGTEAGPPYPQYCLAVNSNKAGGGTSGKFALLEYDGAWKCQAESIAGMVDGGLHTFMGVRDGTTARLYRDGIDVTGTLGTVSGTHSTTTGNLSVGGSVGASRGGSFPILSVQAWNRALAIQEATSYGKNAWAVQEPEEIDVWVPTSAGGSPTVVTLDPAAFNLTPQNTQNTLGASLSASALNFTAQDIQNSATNNLTAAAFDFVAHDIAAENASTATVTLDTATFDFVANDNQNALYAELSAATCDFIANDAQPLTAHSLDVCAFDFVGQDTQNTLGLLLENAIFDFVTRPITAGDPLAPTTGRATNMMLMGVGN